MAIQRSTFPDLFLANKLANLRSIIFEKYAQHNPVGPRLFNVFSMDTDITRTTTVSSTGQMIITPEGGQLPFDTIDQGFDKTYTAIKYLLGLKISREAFQDDEHNLVRRLSSALPRSATDTMETVLANHFNNGFNSSFPGPDGVELFSDVHPLESGGTQRNELSVPADLSVSTLKQMLIDFTDFRDGRGKRINIMPKWLVVPKELQFTAKEILKSTLLADTDFNNINSIREELEIVTWNYLTDPDAWFMVADKPDHELRLYMRENFNIEEDNDFDTEAIKIKSRMRFDSDWSDYRGVFGTPGA